MIFFLNTVFKLDSIVSKSAILIKTNKISPEKGFLRQVKGFLNIYNIFKISNKKLNIKKPKGRRRALRIVCIWYDQYHQKL